MKSYKEYVNEVKANVRFFLSERYRDAEITAQQIDKLQGESYYGLTVRPAGSQVGISLNLTGEYERLANGDDSTATLPAIADAIEKGLDEGRMISSEDILDYDSMKENLMIQVIPTKKNVEMLATIPHKNVEDLSLVYRFAIQTSEFGEATALITNDLLKTLGVSADRLHEDAMKYAPQKFPYSIRSMQEVIAEMVGIFELDVPEDKKDMFVATCNHGVNGAGCMFYPEFMEEAAEKLEGSFYILPSSVHELILLPDSAGMRCEELEALVKQINEMEVEPKDRLSNKVYHYDAREQQFERAQRYEKRQEFTERNDR